MGRKVDPIDGGEKLMYGKEYEEWREATYDNQVWKAAFIGSVQVSEPFFNVPGAVIRMYSGEHNFTSLMFRVVDPPEDS